MRREAHILIIAVRAVFVRFFVMGHILSKSFLTLLKVAVSALNPLGEELTFGHVSSPFYTRMPFPRSVVVDDPAARRGIPGTRQRRSDDSLMRLMNPLTS